MNGLTTQILLENNDVIKKIMKHFENENLWNEI